ncbi:MAG TPA: hypothetical protein VGR12_02910 [Solirubrobacteraceae bacterium]|nr:hypothetical protein [Solirubrobacteraceae bacterium]
MARFFIDTSSGAVATKRQLIARGVTDGIEAAPPRPWLRIQGTDDATTMWYAVLRKRVRGVFIGALALRHSDHYASLLEKGWEEIDVEELRRQAM